MEWLLLARDMKEFIPILSNVYIIHHTTGKGIGRLSKRVRFNIEESGHLESRRWDHETQPTPPFDSSVAFYRVSQSFPGSSHTDLMGLFLQVFGAMSLPQRSTYALHQQSAALFP